MKVTENLLGRPMKESKKKPGNPNWSDDRLESSLIKKHADQWCKDNGYPLQKMYYVYRGKWILKN